MSGEDCKPASALDADRHRNLLIRLARHTIFLVYPQRRFTHLLNRLARKRLRPSTLGADKGYHTKDFVAFLRRKGIAPHIAQIESRKTPGLDARTTRHASYWTSQRKRKRVEEIFGWMKAYGGLRRMHMRGIARVQLHAHLVGAAYNLLRLSRLAPATG